MKKTLEEKKLIVLVVGIFIVMLVIVGGGILLLTPDDMFESNNTSTKRNIKECTGALTWGLKLGDKVKIENLNNYYNTCVSNNYYLKMQSYTYDNYGNIILYMNIGKQLNDSLYDLEDNRIGTFNEQTINSLLSLGTTYAYTFQIEDNIYQLIAMEWVK